MSKPSAAISGAPRRRRGSRPTSAEELVPGAEAGALAVDVDPEHGALDRALARAVGERLRREAPLVDGALAEEDPPLGQLAAQIGLARRDLAIMLVEPARVGIDPGLDPELPGAERVRRDTGSKFVPLRLERCLPPPSRPGGAKRTTPSSLSYPSRKIVAPRYRVAEAGLDGITAAVDLRLDVLDLNPLRLHPRQGKQSDDVALPFRRRQPPPDLAAGGEARARGVRIRRLDRRRGSTLLAGAAAQSARPLRLALRLRLGIRELARPPRRPRRRRRALGAAAIRAGQRVLDRRLDRVRGRRRARRPGAVPARVVGSARLRRRARRADDRRRSDLCRRRQLRPRCAPRALPPRRLRRGRTTRSAQ